MPMYDYKCAKCGIVNEVHHGWYGKPEILCTYCNEPMVKTISTAAIHFKGKGFYSTDK